MLSIQNNDRAYKYTVNPNRFIIQTLSEISVRESSVYKYNLCLTCFLYEISEMY